MINGTARIAFAALAILFGGSSLAACESSQSKNEKLKAQGAGLEQEQGVDVGEANPTVKAVEETSITDENGTAVIVRLKSTDSRDQVDLPVIFDLADASGQSVGDNATPGIQRTLTHATVVPGKSETWWVNDQVVAAGEASKVTVKVGRSETPVPKSIPDFKPSAPVLKNDPVDGIVASGKATNPTATEQRKVLITIVATKGKKVVAAGRGVIAKLKPNKAARYSVFFIGNPKGARLEISATPTLFEGAPDSPDAMGTQ